jgi:hypothetical protein
LRKATKAGLIDYIPGDKGFTIKENVEVSSQQQKALDLAKSIISKIDSTGIQDILNSIIFDVLKLIVVYPVEDDTKLCNKDGEILPDARLLPINSNAKDLAETVHADLAKGFLHAIDAKTKQRIGADHLLKNGDVIKIISSMSRG